MIADSKTTDNTLPTVTDSVTAQTIASDKCDGYLTTQSQKSDSEKINSKDLTAINNENLLSHPSPDVAQSLDSDKSQSITEPSPSSSQPIISSITRKSKPFQCQDRVKYTDKIQP